MNIKRFISILCFVVFFFFLQDPTTHVLGFPSVDLLDTITLRGLFVQQITGSEPALFWPVGYDWSSALFISLRFIMGLHQSIICVFLPIWVNEYAPQDRKATW